MNKLGFFYDSKKRSSSGIIFQTRIKTCRIKPKIAIIFWRFKLPFPFLSSPTRIASQLRLDGRVVTLPKGVKRFAVMARELPPQEIVRRLMIEKDASLSGQYRVLPPRRKARWGGRSVLFWKLCLFWCFFSFLKVKPASDAVPELASVPKDQNDSDESENDSQ